MNRIHIKDAYDDWDATEPKQRSAILWRFVLAARDNAQGWDRAFRELFLLTENAGQNFFDLNKMFIGWPRECVAIMMLENDPDAAAKLMNAVVRQGWADLAKGDDPWENF